jgi:hypothetical protein
MSRSFSVMCHQRGWRATVVTNCRGASAMSLIASLTVCGCAVTFDDWPSKHGVGGGAGVGGAPEQTAGSSAGESDARAGANGEAGAGGRSSRQEGTSGSAGADETGGATAGASGTGGRPSSGGQSDAGSTAAGGSGVVGGATGATTGGVAVAGDTSTTGGATAAGGGATGGKTAAGGSATGGRTSAGGSATGGKTAAGGSATGGTSGTGGQTSPPDCVRFVDVDAPSGGDGLTWATAFRTVAEGTGSAAAAQPCEVWVAEGTYYTYVSSPSDTVHVANGVSVYGGFSGVESVRASRNWRNHVATLSGYSSTGDARVYHVVTAAGSCTLDGLTITGGNASLAPDDNGGGLIAENTSIVVRNGTFVGNYALMAGGGAYFAGGTATVEDSSFSANDAGDSGGALQMAADGVVTRCSVYENSSGNDGAGIAIGAAGPTVQNSIFYRNVAHDFSGGLAVGPGVSGAKVLNNTFYDNDAPHGGGGFSLNADAALAANNLALDNTGKYGPNILVFTDMLATSHHNCANGGMEGNGTDNIDADPELVAPASGDFRLLSSSPCIDQGDDALAPAQDMEGGARVDIPDIGVSVSDMGAYEYRP